MEGTISQCNLKSTYHYQKFKEELESKYGMEKIGEGGFGVILANKHCSIKLVKDINRCSELKKEMTIYNRLSSTEGLIGRIPQFNLFHELTTYCHFNMERIYSPLSLYDDGIKEHVGYVMAQQDAYLFKNLKPKYGLTWVNKNNVFPMERRPLVHFYINHYDHHLKEQQDRGELWGKNVLKNHFGDKVSEFSFAMGQLLSFVLLNGVLPFDVEIVIGTNAIDREITLYMLDFNECVLFNEWTPFTILAAAKSMYNKDGKFYFPNHSNEYYSQFVDGMLSRLPEEIVNPILEEYNRLYL